MKDDGLRRQAETIADRGRLIEWMQMAREAITGDRGNDRGWLTAHPR
jgi:hypothetical protein